MILFPMHPGGRYHASLEFWYLDYLIFWYLDWYFDVYVILMMRILILDSIPSRSILTRLFKPSVL